TSHYDTEIFKYVSQGTSLAKDAAPATSGQEQPTTPLRYGENPHQAGTFYGDLAALFDQLHGKQLSYNNLVDVDAAVQLMREFVGGPPAVAILKHTNACGVAQADSLSAAYANALACDPVSAFGGVIIVNQEVDLATAQELNKLFFEVLIAPAFAAEALPVLQSKKNRILLLQKPVEFPKKQIKTLLNGVIEQDADLQIETAPDFRTVTDSAPTADEVAALEFANKICKHTKSNTIVLARPGQLLASGVGQTSRVDALRQAIEKAASFGFDLKGAVMASDAFFPFPDCVEIAAEAGVRAVVQPGGSIKDQDSIDACNRLGMAMVLTGVRHFKH
ncbi:MAG: bifunctional phosphoribosylaminoimidazolecarboxamide formyltransferase/IMP cyclohydrolase, partial [Hymenobacter sp.]